MRQAGRVCGLALVALVALGPGLRVFAVGQVIGGEFRINVTTTGDQLFNTGAGGGGLAMAPEGRWVATWQGPDSDGTGIYARPGDANGPIGAADIWVNQSVATGSQTTPSVGIAPDGRFVVVFHHSPSSDVYARRYTADGISLDTVPLLVNVTTTGSQQSPAVAVADDGSFVVVWAALQPPNALTESQDILGRRYAADGTPLTGEFPVSQGLGVEQSAPAIAMDENGRFVVAWVSTNQDGGGNGIYARRFNADATPLGSEFPVNTRTAGNQQAPAVAVDPEGAFVIAWEDETESNATGDRFGVYARPFGADGAPLVPNDILVNQTTPQWQRHPSVAVNAVGDFVVVWHSGTSTQAEIFARRFKNDGTPIEDEFQVNTTSTGDQRAAKVGMDANGFFLVGWNSSNQDTSGLGVYAQRFATFGGGTSGPPIPPVITLPGPGVAYTENAAPVALAGAATARDRSGSPFGGGVLTVDFAAGGAAGDRLGILHQGSAAGQVGVGGDVVTFGGTPIGVLSGGSDTTPLLVAFNANATVPAVQAVLRAVTYASVSDNPSTAERTVRFLLRDPAGILSAPATKTVAVTAVNDVPTAADDAYATRPGQTLTVPAPGVLANDADPDGPVVQAQRIAGPNAGTLTLNADGSFSYLPNADFVGTDTFVYQVSDSVATSGLTRVTIAVSGELPPGPPALPAPPPPDTLPRGPLPRGPLPSLSIADARLVEGNSGVANLLFTVRLSAASSLPIGVAFATQDLPASNPRRARAGPDYLPRRGTLTVPPGRTAGTIVVPIRGDAAVEPDESFRLLLSSPTNATLARPSALGTILDNDSAPRVYIDDAERAEGPAGRSFLTFTVGLTRPSPVPVTVRFATLNGTARAGSDFAAVGGTLTFGRGVVKRTILVPVIGDRAREPDEQLRVALSRASVGLADGVGVGTILNDD